MRINANIMAINSHRQLGALNTAQGKATEKLSSGFRINRAADDAAGLAISEKMRSQIRGMNQAARNAQDGISVVQTAEGALDEVHSMLQRMKELAVQSANDSNQSIVDREALQLEVDQLTEEINSITDKTQFNKMKLLDGTFQDKAFHVGANSGETINVSIKSMTAKGLGLKTGGTEELHQASGKTREIAAKGSQQIRTAAEKMDNTKAILDMAGLELTNVKDGEKAKFAAVVNGEVVKFEVEATGGKVSKESIATAATKALNDKFGGGFEVDGNQKVKATNGIEAQSELIGANFKVSLENEHDFKLANKSAVAKSASDAVMGDKLGATVEISHEKGYGHYEISINGEEPKTLVLTKDDGKTEIEAKVKALLGDDNITVDYKAAAANGGDGATATGVITIATKKVKGNEASITVRATGEESRKMVDYKGVNILSREAANKSMKNIQDAIENLASRRAELGAVQNRVEHTIKNLENSAENLTAAESRIRHTDMAKEMMEFTRTNILTQAAQAMLAQANQLPQGVLQLLR